MGRVNLSSLSEMSEKKPQINFPFAAGNVGGPLIAFIWFRISRGTLQLATSDSTEYVRKSCQIAFYTYYFPVFAFRVYYLFAKEVETTCLMVDCLSTD